MTLGIRKIGNPLSNLVVQLPKDMLEELDEIALEFSLNRNLVAKLAIKEFLLKVKRDKKLANIQKTNRKTLAPLHLSQLPNHTTQ